MTKTVIAVVISTSLGDITLELDKEKAPGTVENFINLVESGYYDETIFHRVIDGFMVQGGGLTADMRTKPSGTQPIQNEANNGLPNDRGTIAMARTNDPHSATSQFFINHKDNSFLNHSSETMRGWGYAVFGKVTDGMDVVDAIAVVDTVRREGSHDALHDACDLRHINRVLVDAGHARRHLPRARFPCVVAVGSQPHHRLGVRRLA